MRADDGRASERNRGEALEGTEPGIGEVGRNVDRLAPATTSGLWVVTSSSETRYYLDLDAGLLLRQPGHLSATGPFDGSWVRLVRVTNLNGTGAVQVGYRHKYDLDPDTGGVGDYIWWVQRTATGIHPVPGEDRPPGRDPSPNEYCTPFAHHRPGPGS